MSKNFVPASLLCDFYKTSHKQAYPNGTTKIYSTFTPRSNKYMPMANGAVVFGIQSFVQKYLVEYFEENFFARTKEEVVAEYERYIKFALSVEKPDSSHIAELHDLGYLPIELRALKEGTIAPIQVPFLTLENTHDDFYWLTNYFETVLSNEIWLPMTSATLSYEMRKMLDAHAMRTVGHTFDVPFQAHDFSMRGMSSLDSAMASGAGHLLSFVGTDTIPAIAFLEHFYGADIEKELVGTSIPATEHSVMTALTPTDGERDEFEAFQHLITEVFPNGLVSLVSDSYDFWKVIGETIPQLKEDILSRDGKVVIRPDCYDEETQILTNNGWKYFKDLAKEDLVAQVLDDGTYEFTKPLKYVNEHYKGEMVRFNDSHGKVDLLVTPNHRMIIQQTNSKTKETKERVVFAENLKKKGNHNQKMLRSAKAKSFNKELTDVERLRIAFQADGSYTTSGNKIRFSFSKERKMDRLEAICYRMKISFDKYVLSDGRVEYHLNTDPSKYKKDFSWVDTASLDGDWCVDFIEELSYWDSTRRSEDRFKFDTTCKQVSDVVELIALSAGYGDLISVFEDNREEHFNTIYTHNILKENVVGGQSWTKTVEEYDGNIYCVQVPTGRLIVKRGRGTMVCGNSGNPVDILCGKINYDVDLTEEFKEHCDGDIENLEDYIYEVAEEWASRDCEGAHNIGNDEYLVAFKVGDKIYHVFVGFSYNRHDKTYYYVENQGFKSEGVQWQTLKSRDISIEDKGLIESLWETFGGTVSEQGYKVLDSHIGAIYGDSITYELADKICKGLQAKGFASTNVVFGMGSYSFQYKTRDSLGFAMKATYAEINGEPIMLMKDPKTDSKKKSQRGQVLVKHAEKGGLIMLDGWGNSPQDKEALQHSLLEPVFKDGKVLRKQTLSEVREILIAQ